MNSTYCDFFLHVAPANQLTITAVALCQRKKKFGRPKTGQIYMSAEMCFQKKKFGRHKTGQITCPLKCVSKRR